jgi:hypothetical protein
MILAESVQSCTLLSEGFLVGISAELLDIIIVIFHVFFLKSLQVSGNTTLKEVTTTASFQILTH